MTIKEYIEKNLPYSVNFNVLSTVCKENGSELTEEIKAYLKETPENTNWNIFKMLFNNTPVDLGTLFYQGSLQEGNIIEDEGAIVKDTDEWYNAVKSDQMYMVIENNIVSGTKIDEHHVSFVFNNNTVSIAITTDPGSGGSIIVISGDVPSYYKIYAKQDESLEQ